MYTSLLLVGTLALSIPMPPASAAYVTFEPTPLLVTAGDPDHPRYRRLPGILYDGIGMLVLDHENLLLGCTGALLGSGRSVLTAAHCVTDQSGALTVVSGQITFQSSLGGEETIAISRYDVHPTWTGDLRAGGDIAVLTLQQSASSAIRRYNIYPGEDEVGRVVELVGLGLSGTGAVGYTIEDGRRRGGYNRLDGTFVSTLDKFPSWTAGANAFLIDFDDGFAAHDALSVFGLRDSGTGLDEVFPVGGDSGGPAFLDGSIAAISSFRTRVFRADGTTPDIDTERNGSFGEVGGLTRVSRYEGWITATVTPVPEPGSLLLLGPTLALTLATRRKRRPTKAALLVPGCDLRHAPYH
jgi:hypothetical protein